MHDPKRKMKLSNWIFALSMISKSFHKMYLQVFHVYKWKVSMDLEFNAIVDYDQ